MFCFYSVLQTNTQTLEKKVVTKLEPKCELPSSEIMDALHYKEIFDFSCTWVLTALCGYELPRPPGCTLLGREQVHHAGLVLALPLAAPRCLPGVTGKQS